MIFEFGIDFFCLAPLDLDYASFYVARKTNIDHFLHWLTHTASNEDLVKLLGIRYRRYYRRACRGLGWGYPLRHLQLIALCLGGKGISAVLRTLSIDHKHFSGGLPDLLVVRVMKCQRGKGERKEVEVSENEEDVGEGMDLEKEESKELQKSNNDDSFSFLDLEELLGGHLSFHATQGINPDLISLENSSMLDSSKSLKKQLATSSKPSDSIFDFFVKQKAPEVSLLSVSGGSNTIKNSANHINSDDEREGGEEEEEEEVEDVIGHVPKKYEDPFVYQGPGDLVVPQDDEDSYFKFQCALVEVKGPTDRLSYRQQVWLQVLQESGVSAWVCKISEVNSTNTSSGVLNDGDDDDDTNATSNQKHKKQPKIAKKNSNESFNSTNTTSPTSNSNKRSVIVKEHTRSLPEKKCSSGGGGDDGGRLGGGQSSLKKQKKKQQKKIVTASASSFSKSTKQQKTSDFEEDEVGYTVNLDGMVELL